jgi:Ser/Thr protein kinase RdoA (MazF antagonist)
VSDIVAARRVAGQFSIATPIDEVVRFGAGLVNDTFLVRTSGDVYVLQRINRLVLADPHALMRNVATVSAHLSGRLVPELVEAAVGGWLVEDGPDVWRMWRRVRDVDTCHELSPARVGSAARLIGRFHVAVSDLSPSSLTETIRDFHDPARRLESLRTAIEADPCGRVGGVRAEIDAIVASADLAATATEFTRRLPPQIAHNDAQLNNVLFRADEAVCLVDLDTVMPTAHFWDVGDLLRSASTRGAEDDPVSEHHAVDSALYRAIIDGYLDEVAGITGRGSVEGEAVEVSGLLITYEQALRFLTDYLRGDVYYRTTRSGQNLDRTRAQLALLASMRDSVEG